MAKPKVNDDILYVKGAPSNVKPGDAVLLVGDERLKDPGNENWDFRRIKGTAEAKTADPAHSYTVVTLERGLGSYNPHIDPAQANERLFVLRQRANLFGYNAPDWRAMPDSLQAGYLGKDSKAEIDITKDLEWPGFNLYSLIDRHGLYAEYFDGPDLMNREAAQIDAKVDFQWKSAAPHPALGTRAEAPVAASPAGAPRPPPSCRSH